MIRIFITKSGGKGSLLYSLLTPLFHTGKTGYLYRKDLILLIEEAAPDFVFIDFKKPVNGNDLMSMVSELDEFTRLRVFYIDLFKFRFCFRLPSLHLKDNLLSFLFESRTAKKI